MLDCISYFN